MNQKYYQRLKTYEQSYLGKMFILKIVNAKPQGVDLLSWFEMIFGLHERDIIQYQSTRMFRIPGLYKPVAHVRISGALIPRVVKVKRRIWVRFDMKYPNVIELEAPIAHANEPRVFQLSRFEWDRVKKWLDPVHLVDRQFHEKFNATD